MLTTNATDLWGWARPRAFEVQSVESRSALPASCHEGLRMREQPDALAIRVDRKTRTVVTTYLSIVVGVIVFLVALSLAGVVHNPSPPRTLAGIAIVAIAGGAALILRVVRSRVVLYSDGIEVRRLLWSRRVTRLDIVARRMHPSAWRNPPYHILIMRDGREVNLPPYLEHNTTFKAWLASIPLASRTRLR
jgi:hypothetical protein